MQEALSKSNEIFETFKQEIEKVGIHTFVTFHPVFQTCYPKNDAFLHQVVFGSEKTDNFLSLFMWIQMAKSVKELKKENTFLKSKCEKSDVSLIELVEEVIHCFCSWMSCYFC